MQQIFTSNYKINYVLDNLFFVTLFVFNSRAGIKLEKFVKEKCKELNLPFKPSDMIADTSSGSPTNTNSRKKRKFN